MLTKWVGYGLALTPKAYLKSAWNCLDFVIVMISLVLLAADSFPQVEPAAPRTQPAAPRSQPAAPRTQPAAPRT